MPLLTIFSENRHILQPHWLYPSTGINRLGKTDSAPETVSFNRTFDNIEFGMLAYGESPKTYLVPRPIFILKKYVIVTEPVYLIINADDYGYFACVSRGILQGADDGLITATGVIANSCNFSEHLEWLRAVPNIDMGVHLNLTYGEPLTIGITRKMKKWKGRFPGKYSLFLGLVAGQLSMDDVMEELRAQVSRCMDAGLRIFFLNTHEHVHAFPSLFDAILELKREYNIPYVRFPEPEWIPWGGPGGMVRNVFLQCLKSVNGTKVPRNTPRLLGMSCSGKLSLEYLRKAAPLLKRGNIYELMCHPGFFDPEEIADPHLLSYHRWEQELGVLRSTEAREFFNSNGIRVACYSELLRSNRI